MYAKHTGECGVVPAKKVDVIDTTGAGDAFFAGTDVYKRQFPSWASPRNTTSG